jgi:hypothetical protein
MFTLFDFFFHIVYIFKVEFKTLDFSAFANHRENKRHCIGVLNKLHKYLIIFIRNNLLRVILFTENKFQKYWDKM